MWAVAAANIQSGDPIRDCHSPSPNPNPKANPTSGSGCGFRNLELFEIRDSGVRVRDSAPSTDQQSMASMASSQWSDLTAGCKGWPRWVWKGQRTHLRCRIGLTYYIFIYIGLPGYSLPTWKPANVDSLMGGSSGLPQKGGFQNGIPLVSSWTQFYRGCGKQRIWIAAPPAGSHGNQRGCSLKGVRHGFGFLGPLLMSTPDS